MSVVKADLGLCEGYANCVDVAPETFDLDDDGKVVVLAQTVSPERSAQVEEAVRSCPTGALSIVEQ